MIRYECDKCGQTLLPNDPSRFIVKIEVYAASSHVDLDVQEDADDPTELSRIMEQLRKADPDEVEDSTYRSFRFDLCHGCQKGLLQRPLG